jgi:hypothetical protein
MDENTIFANFFTLIDFKGNAETTIASGLAKEERKFLLITVIL